MRSHCTDWNWLCYTSVSHSQFQFVLYLLVSCSASQRAASPRPQCPPLGWCAQTCSVYISETTSGPTPGKPGEIRKMSGRFSPHTRASSQYKDGLSRYVDFHYMYKDETVFRPSHLYYNGNPYTGKTASLYWDSPEVKGNIMKGWTYFRYLTLLVLKPRHQQRTNHHHHTTSTSSMKTSWHGRISTLLALCEGNPHSPHKRTVMQSFDVFFVSLNNLLNKQSSYQCFETPRHWCDIPVLIQ